MKRRNRKRMPRQHRLTLPRLRLPRWRLPRLQTLLWLSGMTAAAYGAVLLCVYLLDQPLRTILVQGRFQHVTPVQVEGVLADQLGQGFLTADLAAIRADVEKLDWVDRAVVVRVWPDTVRITIREQVAAARWGKSGLLNVRGQLFSSDAKHIPAELPLLNGPPERRLEVAKRYLGLRGRLADIGLNLRSVSVDARGAWRLSLANGVEVKLGRRDVDLRLERFLSVAAAIVAHYGTELAYVDLRYTNGFSVGWASKALADRRRNQAEAISSG